MTDWRVQRHVGYKDVRDWRWAWLRTKQVPVWETISTGGFSIEMMLNQPTKVSFVDPLSMLERRPARPFPTNATAPVTIKR